MYRVKVFQAPLLNASKLEEEANKFLAEADIEIVDCKVTHNSYYIIYIIMYQVW